MAFVHLHVHTEYSLLDGACRIQKLPEVIQSLGQTACAITDHGVMYGAIDFYRACKQAGIKPIIGCEVYVAPLGRTRHDKVHKTDSESRHLVLLCENETGYKNLAYLVSIAWLEGFYNRPRIDLDLLRQHSTGLIGLSACLAGEIPRLLLHGQYEEAKAYALELSEIFGEDHFYLELQDHGISRQREVNAQILRLHHETKIPLVCTNDAHYLRPEDAAAHDVLLCIQTGKTLDAPNRMRYEPRKFYLRSEEEMRALFGFYDQAIENTVKIADMCHLEFTFGRYHLPEFPLPEGYDSFSYLKELCAKGYQERYGDNRQYWEQLEREENMIEQMGFTDYFLIVSDFVRYARNAQIPVGPGRGSAAGSMVSYCLHITDVDPVRYSLYFERFLNPERVSMPDIDMDFGDTRRGEVVEYVRQKYGSDHVAQIVTFGTMAARAVIRDVGRVMNLPYADVDAIAKLIPTRMADGHAVTLDGALQTVPDLQKRYDTEPTVRQLLDTARSLEGMPRNPSTHAAGVVITKRPVFEYVPLARNEDLVVCQYSMTTLESLGLLKMDFLGLRNLTIIDDTIHMIRQSNPDFSLDNIPEDDPAVYDMLSQGQTVGVFQMESDGITRLCMGIQPRNIEDITAIVALYRPGPMDAIPRYLECKQHPEKVTYAHPKLETILANTYGCTIYQEQVIQIFQQLAGYSLGQADLVRRAMSKKKEKDIQRERNAFVYGDEERHIPGCIANGIPEDTAQNLYNDIISFAHYAFNKAHSVCYAIVAYQTAYLKCHYPREYMSAVLTASLDFTERTVMYISACRDMGIGLLPPDINRSCDCFTIEGGDIRFALSAIKNVGRGFIQNVMKERENASFISLTDFCTRMRGAELLNKRALENLIRAGAFDSLGAKRSQLLAIHERVLNAAAQYSKNLEGQLDLFSTFFSDDTGKEINTPNLMSKSSGLQDILPDIPEFSPMERIAMEKEVTGLYLSGSPIEPYREQIRRMNTPPILHIIENAVQLDNRPVAVCGVIMSVRTKLTRNNTNMAYVTLEDDGGSIELLCFSRVLEKFGMFIQENTAVLVQGRVSARDDKASQIICDSIQPLSDSAHSHTQGVGNPGAVQQPTLFLRFPGLHDPSVRHMRLVLRMFPGRTPVRLFMEDTRKVYGAFAQIHDALIQEAIETLGENNVVLQ